LTFPSLLAVLSVPNRGCLLITKISGGRVPTARKPSVLPYYQGEAQSRNHRRTIQFDVSALECPKGQMGRRLKPVSDSSWDQYGVDHVFHLH
jgi:hypothetical protein